jgi:hypothetical protein
MEFLENKNKNDCYFLTLTFNDDKLSAGVDFKREICLFWKRLRKYLGLILFKYFLVFELGSITKRPHYHAIVFNLFNLGDLVRYKKNEYGDWLYFSRTLEKI